MSIYDSGDIHRCHIISFLLRSCMCCTVLDDYGTPCETSKLPGSALRRNGYRIFIPCLTKLFKNHAIFYYL